MVITLAVLAAAGSALAASPTQPEAAHAEPDRLATEWVTHCMPRDPENGDFSLVGGRFPVRVDRSTDLPTPGRAGSARLVPGFGWLEEDLASMALVEDPANRLHLVFVGDGYTSAELGTFASQVATFAEDMFADEPLATYRPLFSVSRVDIASNDSGVDNDPTQGIFRDTELDMAFWCGGTERALCVSVGKALTYANSVPLPDGASADQVVALANTSKYGGVGYPSSNLGTAAAGNSSAVEIVVHELGHALGNLADEYTYGGPTVFPNVESGQPNASTKTAAEMASLQTKWFRWLGTGSPAFDGSHSTFEGAQYSELGVYRPTNNSKMRALGRPFNHVNAEELIKEIYRIVDPIDSFSPDGPPITEHTTLRVTPVRPAGNPLSIRWYFEGQLIEGETGETLDTCAAGITGFGLVEGVVTDTTPWVRDEAFRSAFMTQSATFVISIPANPADVNGDGLVTPADFSAWILAFNQNDPVADQNGDAMITPADLSAWILNYNRTCG